LDEVQGEWELDELVNDLHEEWRQHETLKVESPKSPTASQKNFNRQVVESDTTQQHNLGGSPQLVQPSENAASTSALGKQQLLCAANNNTSTDKHNAASTRPWSLEWLSQTPIYEGGNAFSSPCLNDCAATSNPKEVRCSTLPFTTVNKNKKGEPVKHSVGFMKRAARMPDMDRREISHINQSIQHKRNVTLLIIKS